MTARRFTLAALALALLTTACAEDAVSPTAPEARSMRAPQRTSFDEPVERQTHFIDGIRFDFERAIANDGSVTQTRIFRNGALHVSFAADIAAVDQLATASAVAYDEGFAVISEELSLMGGAPVFRQMSMDEELPCQAESMLFLGASAWLAYELARWRLLGKSNNRSIAAATVAVIKAGHMLWQCYLRANQMPMATR